MPPPATTTLGLASETAHPVSDFKLPFTVSASIREEYDDNIYTTKSNKTSQFITIIMPSFLFNLPMDNTTFSARYTFGGSLYPNRQGDLLDQDHEFLARLTHSFSSRFSIDARERVSYTDQPNIFDSDSTLRQDGSYLNNTFTLEGDAQWTPKFGTVTTYTNDYFDYLNKTIGQQQNRDENILTHDFRFLILPKTTLVFGGTLHSIDYNSIFRSSDSVTGYFGVDQNLSPELVIGGRAGATYTDLLNSNGGPSSYTSPYGAAFVNWQLGARSSVDATYAHQVSTTDAYSFYGQESDNFTIGGRYQLTPRFSSRLQFIYNLGNYDQGLGTTGISFSESVLGAQLTGDYKLNEYLDLEGGYTYTTVISDINSREYDRNQVYLGIRGTY